jgi:hypothetical protein
MATYQYFPILALDGAPRGVDGLSLRLVCDLSLISFSLLMRYYRVLRFFYYYDAPTEVRTQSRASPRSRVD